MKQALSPIASIVTLARTWQGVVILVIVATQLLLPLHYYTVRRDPHDERFAWRMFSPMRMTRCTSQFTVNDAPVPLGGAFHEAWIEIASRGRFMVIEEMAAKLCNDRPGSSVRVKLTCTYVDGDQREYGGYDMCKVPRL
ncbi:MAG: hypothetical protein H0T89_03115 [Deltaproteobacteria bacterium]|nr:hypothetical protein [Deltaproteobacteria bacterium]MDQ3297252.1 hypothetical protein [Myxococcota bacterium]